MGQHSRHGEPEKKSYLGIGALIILALVAIGVVLVVKTQAARDPAPPPAVAPQTPYAARLVALDKLNAALRNSLTKNFELRASLAGEDTLLVESPTTNLQEGMVDFIHRGQGAYADIWPGGIRGFAVGNGFSRVVYKNLPNGGSWTMQTSSPR